ncbi:MAG: T9SS type A sorting domain-containing protein [Gemmatimonadota bacterium]|nr:MAG: T9SS type A sorting domain-containing protein [Gemmatimonadota bacterium]
MDTNYENNYDVENIWFIRVMYGDVGLDEEIEVTDAQKILLWIVQQISLTNYQLVMAEVSGNGTVTAYDASLILQYIQDIIECFPVQEVCPPSCPKPVVFSGDAEVAMGGLLRSGPIVRIPIYVKNAEGVFSAKIAGKYDLKNLEFIKITTTELSKEYLMEYNERNGEVLIAMASAKAVVSKAPMAYAHFRVIGDRGNNDDFTITEFQVNEGPVFTSPAKPVTEHPQDFALNQNHPNPFNPETHISFQLLEISGQTSKHVTLKIYNALGQEVQTLMNEQKEPGYYTVTWDGIDNQGCEFSSGVYFYRLQAENIVQTKKMVLMR